MRHDSPLARRRFPRSSNSTTAPGVGWHRPVGHFSRRCCPRSASRVRPPTPAAVRGDDLPSRTRTLGRSSGWPRAPFRWGQIGASPGPPRQQKRGARPSPTPLPLEHPWWSVNQGRFARCTLSSAELHVSPGVWAVRVTLQGLQPAPKGGQTRQQVRAWTPVDRGAAATHHAPSARTGDGLRARPNLEPSTRAGWGARAPIE